MEIRDALKIMYPCLFDWQLKGQIPMTQTKHTLGQLKIVSNGMDYLAIVEREATIIEWPASYGHVDYANAQFIVRACNAYNLLVEACKVAKQAIDLQLELDDKERERLETDAVALINTALAKAQGKE